MPYSKKVWRRKEIALKPAEYEKLQVIANREGCSISHVIRRILYVFLQKVC